MSIAPCRPLHAWSIGRAVMALWVLAFVCSAWGNGPAGPRIALVIGNNDYVSGPLSNPVNDANAMASALRGAGFAVTVRLDARIGEMVQSLRSFGEQLRAGGPNAVGLFYFAGHGMQIRGRNFLIPAGADIRHEDEVAYLALDAQAVLDKMETAGNGTNLMILDACRNNPFARSFRSASQGLAHMDAPVGTLVAFATAPGAVASDGEGAANGLYTSHLLSTIRLPGLKVEDVFKQVRAAVRRASAGRQVPWEATSLEGDFYFVPPPAMATPTITPAATPSSAPAPADRVAVLDDALWSVLKDSSSRAELDLYLKRFPTGRHARDAKARMDALTAPAQSPPPLPDVAAAGGTAASAPAPASASAQPSISVAAPAATPTPTPTPAPEPAGPPADESLTTEQREARNRISLEESVKRLQAIESAGRSDARAQQRIDEILTWGDENTDRRPTEPKTNAHRISEGDRYRYRLLDRMTAQHFGMQPLWRVDRLEPDGSVWVNDGAVKLDGRGQPQVLNDARVGAWQDWSPPLPTAELAQAPQGERRSIDTRYEARDTDGVLTRVNFSGSIVVGGVDTVETLAGTFRARRVDVQLRGRAERSNGERPLLNWQLSFWYADGIALPVAKQSDERVDGQLQQRLRQELVAFDVFTPRRSAGPTASR